MPVTAPCVTSFPAATPTAANTTQKKTMNAVTAHVPTRAHADQSHQQKPRRRAILAAVAATFLGLYVLGVSWFANELGSEMERSLQIAPAVQDIEHRG